MGAACIPACVDACVCGCLPACLPARVVCLLDGGRGRRAAAAWRTHTAFASHRRTSLGATQRDARQTFLGAEARSSSLVVGRSASFSSVQRRPSSPRRPSFFPLARRNHTAYTHPHRAHTSTTPTTPHTRHSQRRQNGGDSNFQARPRYVSPFSPSRCRPAGGSRRLQRANWATSLKAESRGHEQWWEAPNTPNRASVALGSQDKQRTWRCSRRTMTV